MSLEPSSVSPRLLASIIKTALADPVSFGEACRSYVFPNPDLYGAYSTFEVAKGFQEITGDARFENPLTNILWPGLTSSSAGLLDEGDAEYVRHGMRLFSDGEIDVAWHWDGDGTLGIRHIPSGTILENSDCKTDDWRDVTPGRSES